MPRKKKVSTKKVKKKGKKRTYKKKKTVKVKSGKNLKIYLLSLGGILLLAVGTFFLFPNENTENSSRLSASPIIHLVASLSAQTQPIKINPEFSYQEEELKREPPERIIIPSLKIDLPVVEAEIVDGYWETASASASFGLGSAYPEQVGNTVIFAHAREDLFVNLAYIQKETPIYLFSRSKWYAYEVKEIKTVLPIQVEVISPTEERTLTLFTCSGFRDAYRLVVVAKPIRDQ